MASSPQTSSILVGFPAPASPAIATGPAGYEGEQTSTDLPFSLAPALRLFDPDVEYEIARVGEVLDDGIVAPGLDKLCRVSFQVFDSLSCAMELPALKSGWRDFADQSTSLPLSPPSHLESKWTAANQAGRILMRA